MMNLQDIRDIIILISGDKGLKFSYTPKGFGDLLNLAQLKHYKRKLGLPEEYSPGMPLSRQSYELTSRLTEDLRKFKVLLGGNSATPVTLDTDGHLVYPLDYYIVTALTYYYVSGGLTYLRKVDILNDLQYGEAVSRVSTVPDEMFPVCNRQATYIQFNPILAGNLSMTYLRLPVKPVWAVDASEGFYGYDAVNSVQLEWDDINIIDIITIMLGDIGIPTKNMEVYQYAENLKERGI